MAQTTSAAFDVEKARNPQDPALLLELQLTGETVYLSNRSITVDGQAHTPRLTGAVEIELDGSFTPDGGGQPKIGNARLTLANADDVTGAPWSDLLATRTLPGRRAILRQEYVNAAGSPLALADTMPLLDGILHLPEERLFTDTEVSLEILDGSAAWHKPIGTPITAAAYPGAAAEVIGTIEPLVVGSIKKHKCIPVDIGARTTLREGLSVNGNTVKLTDASGFPSSGSIYIDGDEIAYTAKSGNDLTGASGVGYTHDYGATVAEKKSAYDWLVAGHPCKAISAVYVRRRGGGDADWVAVPAAEYTAYPTGGGGIAGKANVRFGSAKFLQRAVDLSVASHGHSSSGSHSHTYDAQITQLGSGGFPRTINNSYYDFTFNDLPGDSECVWQVVQSGVYYPSGGSVGYGNTTWDGGNAPPQVWTYSGSVGSNTFRIRVDGTNSWIKIESIQRTVTYAPSSGSTTATVQNATASVTGQAVAEAVYDLEVAVDIEGVADDASGTYTGTPNALVILPSDVLKYVGGGLLGWTLASRFDTPSFAAARAAEATAGLRLDFALAEAMDSAALFEAIRHQTMSAHLLTAEGKYKRFVAPFSGASLKTFTEYADTLGPITVGLTPLADLRNVVAVRYQRDPWDGRYRGYTEASDAASQGTGNPPTPGYNRVALFELDAWCLGDATAAVVSRDAWLSWLKRQRYQVELTTFPEWLHLEPWDRIAITSSRMPGDWAAKEFVIQTVQRRVGAQPTAVGDAPEEDCVALVAVEV